MSDSDAQLFSPEDVAIGRMALLRAAGTEPGRLASVDFVCSVSAEVMALKDLGFADSEIAAILERAVGKPVSAEDIHQHCSQTDDLGHREAQRALDVARQQETGPAPID